MAKWSELKDKALNYAENICKGIDGLEYKTHGWDRVLIGYKKHGVLDDIFLEQVAIISQRGTRGYDRGTGVLQISVGGNYGSKKIYPETKAGAGLDRENVMAEIADTLYDARARDEADARRDATRNEIGRFLEEQLGDRLGDTFCLGDARVRVVKGAGRSVEISIAVSPEDYHKIINAVANTMVN